MNSILQKNKKKDCEKIRNLITYETIKLALLIGLYMIINPIQSLKSRRFVLDH